MTALCTARLLGPILKVVATSEAVRDLVPDDFWRVSPDDRIPVHLVHSIIEGTAERLGDEQFGLKLGRSMSFGEAGPFDYVVRTAPTVRESVETAGRYSSLYADGYRVLFETRRDRAMIRVLDEFSWPRTAADFCMSASYRLHVAQRSPFASQVECWFPYPTPAHTSAYERIFSGASLKFNAPFYAFTFNSAYERAPQPGADPMVHSVLRDRLDAVVAEVTRSFALRRRVKGVIEQQLRDSRVSTAPAVARALHMSRRTLSRKLEQEGTTFAEELDAVRREIALSYVCESQRPLAEVSFLLGFSHVESFHRAFKRWTGTTPFARRANPTGDLSTNSRRR